MALVILWLESVNESKLLGKEKVEEVVSPNILFLFIILMSMFLLDFRDKFV